MTRSTRATIVVVSTAAVGVSIYAALPAGTTRTTRAPSRDSAETEQAPEPEAPIVKTATPTAPIATHEINPPSPPSELAPTNAPEPAGPAPRDPLDALRAGLASTDRAERIDAVEAAQRAHLTSALPDLERVDLARDPDAAPTVIRAVASLAKDASPSEHDKAAQTLSSWLVSERGRESPEATGNVSMLVEALGDAGGRDAVRALASALDAGDLPLYVETLDVQALGALGDKTAWPAVARFAARVAALHPTEGIDEELRNEAAQAAGDALKRLDM